MTTTTGTTTSASSSTGNTTTGSKIFYYYKNKMDNSTTTAKTNNQYWYKRNGRYNSENGRNHFNTTTTTTSSNKLYIVLISMIIVWTFIVLRIEYTYHPIRSLSIIQFSTSNFITTTTTGITYNKSTTTTTTTNNTNTILHQQQQSLILSLSDFQHNRSNGSIQMRSNNNDSDNDNTTIVTSTMNNNKNNNNNDNNDSISTNSTLLSNSSRSGSYATSNSSYRITYNLQHRIDTTTYRSTIISNLMFGINKLHVLPVRTTSPNNFATITQQQQQRQQQDHIYHFYNPHHPRIVWMYNDENDDKWDYRKTHNNVTTHNNDHLSNAANEINSSNSNHSSTISDIVEHLTNWMENSTIQRRQQQITLNARDETSEMTSNTTIDIQEKQQVDDNSIEMSTSDSDSSSSTYSIYPFERPFYEQCQPMKQWQTQQFVTCNAIHEINLYSTSNNNKITTNNDNIVVDDNDDTVTLLSMGGSWRSVWNVQRILPNNIVDNIVLKLLKHTIREYDTESFYYHRIDALAMERLTSTNNNNNDDIVQIYSFCGQSVITEMANTTISVREYLKLKSVSSLQRLYISRNLARGLAKIHTIDCTTDTSTRTSNSNDTQTTSTIMIDHNSTKLPCLPTMAHNDVNIANLIYSKDGQIKFNDFNIAIMLRWNATSNVPCGSSSTGTISSSIGSGKCPVRFAAPMWKSPEEIWNISYVDPIAADVYGFGNILYQILTQHQPWTHLEPNGPIHKLIVAELKKNGTTPYVPSIIHGLLQNEKTKSNNWMNRPLIPLYYATISCYQYDPHDRLTSIELYNKLDFAYQYYLKQQYQLIQFKQQQQQQQQKLERQNSPSTNNVTNARFVLPSLQDEIAMFQEMFETTNSYK